MLSPGLLLDLPQLDTDLRTSPVRFLLPSLLIWLDGNLHSEGVRSSPMRTIFSRLRTLDLCCRSISTQELIQQKTPTKTCQSSPTSDQLQMRSHHATVLSLNKTMRSKAGGRRGEQTSRVLKLIAAAFVVKCFNLKIRPEQKPIFFLVSFSSSSPCSFQMNSLPSFCRCFSGQCLGGGEEYVCVCVC